MLKILKNLHFFKAPKAATSYVKKILASNLALGLIALPLNSPVSTTNQAVDSNLIIPQAQLNTAFNIKEVDNVNGIQIPLDFIYMSQGFSAYHPAVDLAAKYATPVKPVVSGTVEEANFSPFGYGNQVLILGSDNLEYLYAHLSKIEVKAGEVVNLSTEIGLVGTTGHATGPHLHLEVRKNGKQINPLSILPTLKSINKLLTSSTPQNALTSIQP